MEEKHRHKFVPVEIAWISVWDKLEQGKAPLPSHVALACRCGAIKLVPAKVVAGLKPVVENYKSMQSS